MYFIVVDSPILFSFLFKKEYYRLVNTLYKSIGERHSALESFAQAVALVFDFSSELLNRVRSFTEIEVGKRPLN